MFPCSKMNNTFLKCTMNNCSGLKWCTPELSARSKKTELVKRSRSIVYYVDRRFTSAAHHLTNGFRKSAQGVRRIKFATPIPPILWRLIYTDINLCVFENIII